jgi:FkbM family methyltransferase
MSQKHHAVFEHIKVSPRIKMESIGCFDAFGIFTRWDYLEGFIQDYGKDNLLTQLVGIHHTWPSPSEVPANDGTEGLPPWRPECDENYFGWIDVIEAVLAAKDRFVMIELGAGYGRWLLSAVGVLRHLNPIDYRLIAVEAEPTHFKWLKEHMLANDVKLENCELINAAIGGKRGIVNFFIGNPSGWYGQAIDVYAKQRDRLSLFEKLRSAALRLISLYYPNKLGKIWVEAIPLAPLLDKHGPIDLIDLDVQGSELEVLASAMESLNATTKRVHIGTHSAEIEMGLREVFSRNDWECLHDFPCFSSIITDYGKIEFVDGLQTWVNPRFI